MEIERVARKGGLFRYFRFFQLLLEVAWLGMGYFNFMRSTSVATNKSLLPTNKYYSAKSKRGPRVKARHSKSFQSLRELMDF
jgi:hypothetical protein